MTSVILKEGMCLKETSGAYSMTGRIYENFAYCSLFSLKVGSPFSVLLYSTWKNFRTAPYLIMHVHLTGDTLKNKAPYMDV